MTGAEHYREAERLLDQIVDAEAHGATDVVLKAAQVHATLAMTAAIAEMDVYAAWDGVGTGRSEKRAKAWAEVMAQ